MDHRPDFIANTQQGCMGNGSATAHTLPVTTGDSICGVIRAPLDCVFNGRLRHRFLSVQVFASMAEAKLLAEQRQIGPNAHRPHSALLGPRPQDVLQPWKAA